MEVVEPDGVGPEAAEALVDLRPQHVRTAFPGVIAALGRDNQALRHRRERGTDRRLAVSAGVEVGGVDVTDARCDRFTDERDVLRRVREAIRSQSDAGDLGVTEAY